mmetsp:Transcript_32029/g.54019  ORF Transcript_32029/g.54019 Transcript_32029/m.54019 type:complete len:200 (+) Transcript_32029:245-844(+)
MKIRSRESSIALSGVEAPEVTPMVIGPFFKKSFFTTISPSSSRCVTELSSLMHSPRLIWYASTPNFSGISLRCAVFELSNPPTTRTKSSLSSLSSTRSVTASWRSCVASQIVSNSLYRSGNSCGPYFFNMVFSSKRPISLVSRLYMVVWLARPSFFKCVSGSKPFDTAFLNLRMNSSLSPPLRMKSVTYSASAISLTIM